MNTNYYAARRPNQRWLCQYNSNTTHADFKFEFVLVALNYDPAIGSKWSIKLCTNKHTTFALEGWWEQNPAFAEFTMILLCAEAHS